MWMILQAEKPEDWVIATGVTTTVRDFVIMSFAYIGIELEFNGEGLSERATIKSCSNLEYQVPIGQEVISVDERYFRPTEVDFLLGNPKKANTKLGWKPKYDLKFLVDDMMENDLKLMSKEQYLKNGAYKLMNYFE
jgi:GDPmannose 4,6-dehydratase